MVGIVVCEYLDGKIMSDFLKLVLMSVMYGKLWIKR